MLFCCRLCLCPLLRSDFDFDGDIDFDFASDIDAAPDDSPSPGSETTGSVSDARRTSASLAAAVEADADVSALAIAIAIAIANAIAAHPAPQSHQSRRQSPASPGAPRRSAGHCCRWFRFRCRPSFGSGYCMRCRTTCTGNDESIMRSCRARSRTCNAPVGTAAACIRRNKQGLVPRSTHDQQANSFGIVPFFALCLGLFCGIYLSGHSVVVS